jgi:hypothetical protein
MAITPPRSNKHKPKRARTPTTAHTPSTSHLDKKPHIYQQVPAPRHLFQDELPTDDAHQPLTTQLSDTQRKYQTELRGQMCPSGPALSHPAASMLLDFAYDGCPAETGADWTLELLDEAVRHGSHPSAQEPEAAEALLAETRRKVSEGFARIIPWKQLREHLPKTLKVSPIAAIPHKSRMYRMILDLSYGFRLVDVDYPSVNDNTTDDSAPMEAMHELGSVLPRIIHALATTPVDATPLLFAKLDIKDGFWRMVVPEKDEYNFAYVLPQLPGDDSEPQIVVPSSLQMGWKHSPPYFCAASETGRDVGEHLLHQDIGSLPPHPFEKHMLDPMDPALLRRSTEHPDSWDECALPDYTVKLKSLLETHQGDFFKLLEVYIDDFIGVIHSDKLEILRHATRAMLHGIHSVFPPPSSGLAEDDPISYKKLMQGDGVWAVRKEILGWIFDGILRTMELPPDKVIKLLDSLSTSISNKWLPLKEFRTLLGKLQHAALAMPAGKSILTPLHKFVEEGKTKRVLYFKHRPDVLEALRDIRILLRETTSRPTHVRELVPDLPAYIGFCDACKRGGGGVWLSGSKNIRPVVWRLEWPADIQARLVSWSNPHGDLTINDLEMAGLLLQYLVVEQLVDLRHEHVAAWCDNTSTVSWARRMTSSRSRIGHRLVRALMMRINVNQASPLVTVSIQGCRNDMADVASRSFGPAGQASATTFESTNLAFLKSFNSQFPLEQGNSWQLFRISTKLSSLVFSELRTQPQSMDSWRRLTRRGNAIGVPGSNSVNTLTWTPSSDPTIQTPPLQPCRPLLHLSDVEASAEGGKLALKLFKSRYVPSARTSNWRQNPTRATKTAPPPNTGKP